MNLRFFALMASLLLAGFVGSGCVATSEDVRGAYIRQAKIEEKVDSLAKEVEGLKAQMEGAGEANLVSLQERLRRLEQALGILSARMERVEGRGAPPGPLRFPSGRLEATPPPSPPSAGEFPPSGEGTAAISAGSEFGVAYGELGRGNYAEARALFKEFAKNNEDSPQLSDAYYWIAESFYREGRYEESILEFQSFIDRYPQDQRVPRAYLKQGLSLINIKRPEEARLFLQTLVDKYPRSEEAAIAKEKIRELAIE